MEFILVFLKKAIAALLALCGVEYDEAFVENVEVAVKDVVDLGNELAAK